MTTWQRIKLFVLIIFLSGMYFSVRYPISSITGKEKSLKTDPLVLSTQVIPITPPPLVTQKTFEGDPVYGIDVSKWQGDINWEKLKEGHVSFAFIKATEGKDEVDKRFQRNWKQADKQGIYRGAYHYYNPGIPPKKQAANFIKQVKMKEGDLPPVLDLEEPINISKEKFQKNVQIWLDEVEKHFKIQPIIYASPIYYRDYLAKPFGKYRVWIAKYQSYPDPVIKGSDQHWLFWQFSNRGRISGIKENVDLDVFYGSLIEFKTHLKK